MTCSYISQVSALSQPQNEVAAFGPFRFDLSTGELAKHGLKLPLEDQPAQVLRFLIQHADAVVSRDDLRNLLWPDGIHVDYEHGVDKSISKLRTVLGDDSVAPRFIATIRRRGYRFIGSVEIHTHVRSSRVAAAAADQENCHQNSVLRSKPPDVAETPAGRKTPLSVTIACIVLTAVAGIAWSIGARGTVSEPQPVPVPLTSYPGIARAPSFSPDGNHVAFLWGPDVFVKLIGKDPPVRLTSNHQGNAPTWSPDGRFIAFQRPPSGSTRSGVFLMPAIGGPERQVAETSPPEWGEHVIRIAWHASGHWLVVPDRASSAEPHALFLVSVETGEKRKLTSPPLGIKGDVQPAVSPDGSAVVFARFTSEGMSDLYLLELSDTLIQKGDPKRLTSDEIAGPQSPVWMPDGRGILFTAGAIFPDMTLWKLPLSRPGWRPGKAQRLAFAGEDVHRPAVSRQGQLAFEKWNALGPSIWRLEVSGAAEGKVAGKPPVCLIASSRLDLNQTPQYSPDGKRIAFGSNRSGSHEMWVCDADGSNATQLTSFRGPYTAGPKWSPDGKWITFDYRSGRKPAIYVLNSHGGVPHRLTSGQVDGWSRDGKWIYFTSDNSAEHQVWRMPPDGGDATQVTKNDGANVVESPDGNPLYYYKGDNEDVGSIWSESVARGKEVQLIHSVCPRGFVVVQQGIYFLPDGHHIAFFSFATQKSVTLLKVEQEVGWGLSLSPDSRWLLYPQLTSVEWSDLMLVENIR